MIPDQWLVLNFKRGKRASTWDLFLTKHWGAYMIYGISYVTKNIFHFLLPGIMRHREVSVICVQMITPISHFWEGSVVSSKTFLLVLTLPGTSWLCVPLSPVPSQPRASCLTINFNSETISTESFHRVPCPEKDASIHVHQKEDLISKCLLIKKKKKSPYRQSTIHQYYSRAWNLMYGILIQQFGVGEIFNLLEKLTIGLVALKNCQVTCETHILSPPQILPLPYLGVLGM